ncbi:MAG TPA: alpha/beta hydrolase [Cytophagaceae bacterium]|jgi:pimeloyl-ACP methyl ester carboxylesterase|nr:alpha/beta hydrolase [Cytophagaceae bacterium]
MSFTVREEGEFKYIDEGKGEVFLLLHGLFGALSNWEGVIRYFSTKYRVIIPLMPIYEMPIRSAGIEGLVSFIDRFVKLKSLDRMTLLGNSLGGHIALVYTLNNKNKVNRLVLTGSSGLFENSMGSSYPKRGSYDYVQQRVGYTFYNPKTATKELVDEVFDIVSSIPKCMRIVSIAKSAQRHNMANDITNIAIPTLLVWGLNDTITPPIVGHEFNRLIPNSELKFIDHCGHAPMMEHPDKFNKYVQDFLDKHS